MKTEKLKLKLNADQLVRLMPYFNAVIKANENGKKAAIGAQIWPDGIVVKLFEGEKAAALADALGGSFDEQVSSAAQMMRNEP